MNDDVDPPEAIAHRIGHGRAALGGGDISRHKEIVGKVSRARAGRGEDHRSGFAQSCDYGFPDPFCAARDERPKACESQIVVRSFVRVRLTHPFAWRRSESPRRDWTVAGPLVSDDVACQPIAVVPKAMTPVASEIG